MTISSVHHVALSVSNLEQSVAFYEKVLGFKKSLDMDLTGGAINKLIHLRPDTKTRSIMMRQKDSIMGQVELVQFLPADKCPSKPKRPGDPGVFLLSFEVTGEALDTVYARLLSEGISCYCEPQTLDIEGYGDVRALVFEDPDGIMIELVQLPEDRQSNPRMRSRIEPAG